MKNVKMLIIALLLFCTPSILSAECAELIELREMCYEAFQNNNTTKIDKVLNLTVEPCPVHSGYRSLTFIFQAKISNSPMKR